MPIPKVPVSWPLTGGLDSKKSPLAIQPGSHLVLDDVVQERLNEWRRRYGFSSDPNDTLPEPTSYFIGQLGDSGMFENGLNGLALYSPSVASGRWASTAFQSWPSTYRSRKSLVSTPTTAAAMAIVGNMVMVAGTASGNGATGVVLVDLASGVSKPVTYDGATLRFRGAATAGKLVMFQATSAGDLKATVVDPTTGVASLVTVHAGGGHATVPYLDAFWYGGSTITVVWRTSTDAVRFIEFNPATGANATDTTIAGVSCANALSLMPDRDATGIRAIGTSHTTPTTRVVRVNSAGAVQTNDQVEAVAASQITGGLFNGGGGVGADWTVLYQSATTLRVNSKLSGVVGTPGDFAASNASIDSMGWFYNGTSPLGVILGLHSTNPDDPQDSYVEYMVTMGSSSGVARSAPVTLAAGKALNSQLYQVTVTSALRVAMALAVQVVYEDNAGTIVRHYTIDLFRETYLQSSDKGTGIPTQQPVPYKETAFIPNSQIDFYDGGAAYRLGTFAPPIALSVTSSAAPGGLTSGAQYGYVTLIETLASNGDVWRSPPSAPFLITLGPTDTQASVTGVQWNGLYGQAGPGGIVRVSVYRTDANGSSYRRIYSELRVSGGSPLSLNDTLADSAIDQGEVLYTIGELSTAITPPARAVWLFDDRLWAINAEYPTEAWYTKNLRPGRQPEFTNEGIVDQDDDFGELTNGAHLDDKGVLFKKNAIYFMQGSGFTDSGSGSNYTVVQISGDVGAIAGSPVVSTGQVIYFVSERGIYSVDKQGVVAFVGEGVDQYLNQPLVQTPETIYDGCFVPSANEVRFVTTNYILVHSLTFNTWTRWRLAGFKRCLVIGGKMVLFKSDGTVWREGDKTQLTDGGVDFTGEIRSPWMRPSQGATGPGTASMGTTSQQGLRLYQGRVTYTRTPGGNNVQLAGTIYRDNDDAKVETFTSDGIDGSVLSATGTMQPRNSKCTSFSLGLTLPAADVTLRVDGFEAIIGIRDGAQSAEAGSRWR